MYEQVRDAVLAAIDAAGGDATWDQVLAAVPRDAYVRLPHYLSQLHTNRIATLEVRFDKAARITSLHCVRMGTGGPS